MTWTITLTNGDFVGTISATPGLLQGQLTSPCVTTFTGNGTLSKTLTFTPLDPDTITFTFTNSGSLPNQTPLTYISTGAYLLDTFPGSGSIQTHTSSVLPSGVAGSSWTTPSAGAITLDGAVESTCRHPERLLATPTR